jgi:nitrate reductase beta subunit
VHKVALPLLPGKGTGPNVYYVPPFNPPRRGNSGKGLLEDPRIPWKTLTDLFGPKVKEVAQRLEAELSTAQAGGRSEVLQLLIGRDDSVRYRIAAKTPAGHAG